MIFTASDAASSLHPWEVAEYVSEGFVIVGCAGEFVADFFTRIPEETRKHVGKWSTIVLILALSAGLKCLVKTNQLSGTVIGSLGDKATEASEEAQKALRDSNEATSDSSAALSQADEALASSGRANREASKAEDHLTVALQRTGRLEQQLSWRTVTPEQKAKLKTLLLSSRLFMPLSGLKINISFMNQDPESEEYARELKNALAGFGAEIAEPREVEFIGPVIQGVKMTANPFRNPRATFLLNAVRKAGIAVSGQFGEKIDEHEVDITIGLKPHNSSFPAALPGRNGKITQSAANTRTQP